ncbi:MAG: hypothetical protein JSU79_02960 [Dehalococcoidales bacterium]|nr:MAG: hypothetical protein JSU79_02960 [Dehalococcoidales bacterium]
MHESQEKERTRLFTLDETLRTEGQSVLERSGIGKIIYEAGFHPVGSFVMKTMTWRDMDFERYDENPSWIEHWELGRKLSELDWIWSLHCNDSYRDPRTPNDYGYYWGLRVSDPDQEGKEFWKIDLWTARKEEFEKSSPNRELWNSLMTEEKRHTILAIKDAFWTHPQYRQTLLSVHIYEAVLEYGISNLDGFWEFWESRYGKPAD